MTKEPQGQSFGTDAVITLLCRLHNMRVKHGQVRYAGEGEWYLALEQAHCPEGMGGCRDQWCVVVLSDSV